MQLEVITAEPLYPKARTADPSARRLALGILLQAFRDIVSPRRSTWKKGEDWQADAEEWFDSESDHAGSLRWVCDHLHIDRFQLRKWLKRYRNSDQAERKEMARRLVRFQIPRSA